MFDPIALSGGRAISAQLLTVLTAAIEAVDPIRAVRTALECDRDRLRVDGEDIDLPAHGLQVLAIGKAAAAMTHGVVEALPGVPITGMAVTPDPAPTPAGIEVLEGGHPSPNHHSAYAGNRLLATARRAKVGDLVLVLVSGGGSACAEVPMPGLSIEHLAGVTDALLASGAPIDEVNTVRRSLSILKGGGLAAAIAPARMVTLVLSDVVGNHLPTIAGGPTVADPTGRSEALAIIEDRGLATVVSPQVLAHLREAHTPAPAPTGGPVRIVADGATAAEGACAAAGRLGIPAIVADTAVTGEARSLGRRLAVEAERPGPHMAILAGETTVDVAGRGSGGRNQEAALAAAVALEGRSGCVVASLGTDGVDGPTPAAGGAVDGETAARGRAAGLDALTALTNNDSGTYLAATGNRLVSGPTGTNVGDVMVAWRWR